MGTGCWVESCLFVFLAYALSLPELRFLEKITARWRMRKEYKKMQRWADHCPVNFLHHRYLMEAELARHANHYKRAAMLYDQAIETAQKNEYPQYEALCNEWAACFYLAENQRPQACLYLKKAHYCYQRWGAVAKVKQLNDQYADLLAASGEGVGSDAHRYPVTLQQLDFHTLRKSMELVTSARDIEQILQQVMPSC